MRASDLVGALRSVFGLSRVRVVNASHVRLKATRRSWHDFYVTTTGQVKVRFHGSHKTIVYQSDSLQQLLRDIQGYDNELSHFGSSPEPVDLASKMKMAKDAMPPDLQAAAFVDAGEKDGIATMAYIYVRREEIGLRVFAESWSAKGLGPNEAEILAIRTAMAALPDSTVIFSDSGAAVTAVNEPFRVRWLSRDQNRAADALANRRHGNNGS